MATSREFAGSRKGFDILRDNRTNFSNQQNVWQLSEMSAATTVTEPVSVQEVLKTLSQRSGQPTNSAAESGPYQTQVPTGRQVGGQTNQGGTSVSPGGSVTVSNARESSNNENSGQIEWVFQNGKWVPIQVGTEKPAQTPKEKEHIES